MAIHSLPAWKQLAERSHHQLFRQTGVLWIGNSGDTHMQQMLEVLKNNHVTCNTLSATEIRQNYPQLSVPETSQGILEPDSGVLMARESVQALVRECMKMGVDYISGCVLPPAVKSRLNAVITTSGQHVQAAGFIFCCGPWLPKVFPDLLTDRIHPTRQEVFYLGVPAGDHSFRAPKLPAWLHHSHPLRPYSVPDIRNQRVKIAFDRHGPNFDPDTGSRVPTEESILELRTYLKTSLPALHSAPLVEIRVCQYENTSNGDLLIDRHPEMENVWLVGGGSGHSFKHGPAISEHVKGLLLDQLPVEPRFSLVAKQTSRVRAVY